MGENSVGNVNTRITGPVTSSDTPDGLSILFRIEAGPAGRYRLAQLDDYSRLPRGKLLYRPPVSLTLQARVSDRSVPGTWGFGFWNDPFALGMGIQGSGVRLPALPQAAWFFFGSLKNDLSFQSTTPANGLLTSVFVSQPVPPAVLTLGFPLFPLLLSRKTARLVRRLAASFIHDEYAVLNHDATQWHSYRLDWLTGSVIFSVDGQVVYTSKASPRSPLGLVIWIDNQFAAFSADGSVHFGTQENAAPAFLEIRQPVISVPEDM